MKKPKAGRVPVLEKTFELNLPKLLRAAKAKNTTKLVLDDGDVRTVVVLSETRLAVMLGGRVWVPDIVAVSCLGGRLRPLLKCPRAHEGNFQALYYCGGELACRYCHGLRYRSNLAATATDRARLARFKLLKPVGGAPGEAMPARPLRAWRERYRRLAGRLMVLSGLHYDDLRRRWGRPDGPV